MAGTGGNSIGLAVIHQTASEFAMVEMPVRPHFSSQVLVFQANAVVKANPDCMQTEAAKYASASHQPTLCACA